MTFSRISEARGGQMKGLGLSLTVDVSADSHYQLFQIAKDTRRSRFCVRSRKKRSSMFNHDALVGVKCI